MVAVRMNSEYALQVTDVRIFLPFSAGLDAVPNPVLAGAPNVVPVPAVVLDNPNTGAEPKVLP